MFKSYLIFVCISFLLLGFIFSPYSTFSVFGEAKSTTKTSGIDCIPDQSTNIVTCCYKEYDSQTGDTTAIYCATCYENNDGNLACDSYDKVESIRPPDDNGISPKGKGIGDLLEKSNPLIQSLS
ncbi:MAG: hypothetical protein DA328_08240, partial [Nitrososphaeraceae archaeon]|nr:hypothetical protein [Nitrososphaeraceae archaeon]